MPNALQNAGALSEPSNFAPLHTNRIFTGLWTNRSFLRDAATNDYQEHYGMGRQDSILDGLNTEITPRLTLARRPGSTVYNPNVIAPVNRFYSFNTFNLTDELIRVMADTAADVLDATDDQDIPATIWHKSPGAGSTYFVSVGNTLYFTNGVENKQWSYGTGNVWDWGIQAPTEAPTVTQTPRPNNYPAWAPGTAYEVNSPAISGMLILDDLTNVPSNVKLIPTSGGGQVAVMCGQNFTNGSSIALPPGFDSAHLLVWVTAGVGYSPTDTLAGVYQSYGTGGVLNSSFQNRSGGYDCDATNNWIAIAWTPSDATIAPYTTGNYSGIVFTTAQGGDVALQIGIGANGTDINVPTGFSLAQSLSQLGMTSCDNVNHAMQGVWECKLVGPTITNLYDDGSGNVWNGNTAVFSVFTSGGGGITTAPVTNGTALLIPTTGTDSVALIFAMLAQGQQYGLPPGFTLNEVVGTCAMAAHASSPGNRGHGWTCLMNGQTFTGFVLDASGNQWAATANVFAVGAVTTGSSGNVQFSAGTGTTGTDEPTWNQVKGGTTPDNTITWTNLGPAQWQPGANYPTGSVVMGVVVQPLNTPNQLFVATTPGVSGATQPRWQAGTGLQTADGGVVWTCLGRALTWADLGPNTPVTAASSIVDSNGYLQTVYAPGVSGNEQPTWATVLGGLTNDGTVVWQNMGAFAVGDTGARRYGYEYMNSTPPPDLSNMSPASTPITVMQGNYAVVQGMGSGDPQVDSIVIFRTAQDGSTFLYAATIPNPGAGKIWTWLDTLTDDDLNTEWQAQIAGEGTPLPVGATALGYHLQRIVAAVGNVVYLSSGPDAVVGGSSGNAGFDTTFTCQSKITRFYSCAMGLLVFTVRDTYIILGDGATTALYMVVFSEDLPLRSYDCFTVNMTTVHMLLGNNMLVTLDPGAGILEEGFPIADHLLFEYDASASYVTYHKQSSLDAALYVANGSEHWYRMNTNNAPEQGSAWSPRAVPLGGIRCVQSVEVTPGQYRLLMSGTTPGPILQRDIRVWSDNGTPYPAWTRFGSIVLALPGQLAALQFITLESAKVGTRPTLALLLGEARGTFEALKRTHQDPTNLPPSKTIYSDRYHFLQSQNTAWCRHFQMEISWAAEALPNELFTYTIFGQTWQEMRSQ